MQLETLVREFLFECEIREYTPRTVENYKKQLRHFTEFLKEYCSVETLEEVQASHVKAFIKHYQMRQCKPSYINDNLKAVKVLCSYAFRENYVDHLITANIENVKEPKTLIHTFSTDEIKKMIQNFFQISLEFLLYCGWLHDFRFIAETAKPPKEERTDLHFRIN